MDYKKFSRILNKHIFDDERKGLLRKIADRPDRFIGLFRPTKPAAKVLQYLLQSHEIRFGGAMEELTEEFLIHMGFQNLPKNLVDDNGNALQLDQYFTDGRKYFFIEQKMRNDHDSTKKRGQMSNFEKKVEILHGKHGNQLSAIQYFIDPNLSKNKKFYIQELDKLEDFYGVEINLFYGQELFDYLRNPGLWDDLISWLIKWKDSLPELPEINFDATPQESFEEIKDLELRYWRKILENEKLWDGSIMGAIFREGTTLNLLLEFFRKRYEVPYRNLARILSQRIIKYY